jgi:hypothetical protein
VIKISEGMKDYFQKKKNGFIILQDVCFLFMNENEMIKKNALWGTHKMMMIESVIFG